MARTEWTTAKLSSLPVNKTGFGSAFGAYWLGQTISILGTNVTLVVMPWIVLNRTHSALTTTMTMALEFVPYLFLSIPLGWLADKMDRRRLMMIANLARAVMLASIPLVSLWKSVSMAQLYSVTVAMSVCTILFTAANAAAIPNLVPLHQLSAANRKMQMGAAFGSTFGAPLGGLLMTWVHPSTALWLDCASYAMASLCLLTIDRDFHVDTPARQSHPGDMLEGLRFILRTPILRSNALVTAANNFGSQLSFGILIFYTKMELHLSSHTIGWILGVWGIGMFFGSWLMKRIGGSFHAGRIMLYSRFVSIAAQLLFAWWGDVFGLGIASILNGLSMSLFNVQSATLKQIYIPDVLRGRVASVHQMIAWLTIPLGLVVSGALAGIIHAPGVFELAAGMQVLSALIIWRSPLCSLQFPQRPLHRQ